MVLPMLFMVGITLRLFSMSCWAFLLVWASLAVGLNMSVDMLESWWKFCDELLKDFESPKFDPDKILIIRSPGDEASSALDFVQLIARLTVAVWVRARGLSKRFEARARRWAKQKKKLVAVPAIMFVVTVLLSTIGAIAHVNSHLQLAIFATGSVITSLVGVEAFWLFLGSVEHATIFASMLVSAIVWPVVVLLSVLLLPFGREVAKANIRLDVTAETTPVGSWTVHLVEPPTIQQLDKDTLPLMHSVAYENPEVLKVLGDWIKARS
jgi:hypothetical protein